MSREDGAKTARKFPLLTPHSVRVGNLAAAKEAADVLRNDRREILNSILYVLRTGGAWRELPHDLPLRDTVYGYFRRWIKEGLWAWTGGRLRN